MLPLKRLQVQIIILIVKNIKLKHSFELINFIYPEIDMYLKFINSIFTSFILFYFFIDRKYNDFHYYTMIIKHIAIVENMKLKHSFKLMNFIHPKIDI
jgi:hypothetical protein